MSGRTKSSSIIGMAQFSFKSGVFLRIKLMRQTKIELAQMVLMAASTLVLIVGCSPRPDNSPNNNWSWEAIQEMESHLNCYDSMHNSDSPGFPGEFYVSEDSLVVVDKASGLMWSRLQTGVGSMDEAFTVIEEMNRTKFADFSDWRLPTLSEACTLLRPGLLYSKLPAEFPEPYSNRMRTSDQISEDEDIATLFRSLVVTTHQATVGVIPARVGCGFRAVRSK